LVTNNWERDLRKGFGKEIWERDLGKDIRKISFPKICPRFLSPSHFPNLFLKFLVTKFLCLGYILDKTRKTGYNKLDKKVWIY
jgi:hypothetical protein